MNIKENIFKIIIALLVLTFLVVGCSKQSKNEEVMDEGGMTISESDRIASESELDGDVTINIEGIFLQGESYFVYKTQKDQNLINKNDIYSIQLPQDSSQPKPGDRVALTIKNRLQETYPSKGEAIKMEIISEKPEVFKADINWGVNNLLNHLPENTQLIDVRTEDEYKQGHIPGSTLIPLDTVTEKIEESFPNKDDIYLIYCRSGNRSATAAQILLDKGYKIIFDIGGINSYKGDLEK